MGVFVTGRQVALEIDMPGWWLANASVDMDFRRGLYYDSSTANPRAATDFLSCTRASIGYATNADGTLTQFASNVLRISNQGMLIEDARTNICKGSQSLNSGGGNWQNVFFTSVTDNAAAAPDGTITACSAIGDTSANPHRINNQTPVVGGTAAAFSFTVYLKSGTCRYGWISAANTGTGGYGIMVDLTNGAITETNNTGGQTGVSNSVTGGTSGWWRLRVTMNTSGSSDTFIVFGPSLVPVSIVGWHSAGLGPGDAGDGTSNIYAWGAQVEQASFPSSYIPTTGAAATRAADAVTFIGNADTVLTSLPNSTVVDLILESTGSFVANAHIIGKAGSNAPILMNSNTVVWGFVNATFLTQATLGNSLTFAGGVKVAQAQSSVPASSLVGGGGTVSNDAVAQGTSGLSIMNSATGQGIFAYCRRVTLWNSKLADATLTALTAP